MGTFDGLNVGLSALYAQRRAIDITGQNLANVNTKGYSRQRSEMVAESGPVVPALFSRYEGTGLGVRSVDVLRIRDLFLESRAHREHATSAYLGQAQATMDRIELAFAEPSNTGLAAQLADFWAGWDDVGLNPADPAARSQLLERAGTLVASFQQLDQAIDELGAASVEELTSVVAEVNALASRIAELNGSIRTATAAGLSANDLADQRDVLAMQLAEHVGATVRPNEDGSLDVYIGGMALVRSSAVEHLAVRTDPAAAVWTSATVPGLEVRASAVHVVWADDGLTASVGGKALGLMETNNDIVPGQRAQLAEVAEALVVDVNALHATGFDQSGAAGGPFFAVATAGVGARGLVVDPAVAVDPSRIAASGSAGAVDGSVAQQLAALDRPDVVYREMVVRLGVAAQTTNRRVEVQTSITQQLDSARESQAGVNIDEEMTNLVAFQHAYSAAARFITVVDDMLDTLIGMVQP